jgi:hypothetical protein
MLVDKVPDSSDENAVNLDQGESEMCVIFSFAAALYENAYYIGQQTGIKLRLS